MHSALKASLEDLLRARRLQAEAPPLRGEDRRLAPLPTGIAAIDALLRGGFPRGQISEIHGSASSGRMGLALSLVAHTTKTGALAAWVDPADRLDPASAAATGVDLARLLWLRGEGHGPRSLSAAVAAVATLLGSGLFEGIVLDLAGVALHEIRRLPGATWIRLQRMIEDAPAALVLVAGAHVAHGPGGVSLVLHPAGPRWTGEPGPGRLLRALGAEARAGRFAPRATPLELTAVD
jgi:recA bacterial DNA recombination protein